MNNYAERQQILELTRRYAESKYGQQEIFVAGETPIPPSGKVLGAAEMMAAVDACLDGWLTTGRFNERFEARMAN